MAKGPSGRLVIVVEPDLKRELYVELARRDLTLKAWFIDQATNFLETSHQPTLFLPEDNNSQWSQTPSGFQAPFDENSE